MERGIFEKHLDVAAGRARDLARRFLEENLPDSVVFHLHLNASHDAGPLSGFRLFRDDTNRARAVYRRRMPACEVVDDLWRDRFVPQWIDIAVVGLTADATILELTSCGRYTDTEERLYYTWTDCAPFGVKGPVLPARWKEGETFSIFTRSHCWRPSDITAALAKAEHVWSLATFGRWFDDERLLSLRFPKLHILELTDARVGGTGLAGLAEIPTLRHLRLDTKSPAPLDFGPLPVAAGLETVRVRGPEQLLGIQRLADALPGLREITLESERTLRADPCVVGSGIETVRITCPALPTWPSFPNSLRELSIHCTRAVDEEVRELLRRCPSEMTAINLRGTPISDAVLTDLERFEALRFVDVVGTRVSKPALARLAQTREGFHSFPRLP